MIHHLINTISLNPFVSVAQAAEGGFDLIGKIECAETGNCEIIDIIQGFGILMDWAVSISGAIALLMFIIGGVYMLASAGRAEWVKRGKDILVGTSVALFFIFSSWLIVSFITKSLVGDSRFQLGAGVEQKTFGPDQSGPDIYCQQPNREGVPCGGPNITNMLCHNQQCISKCAYNLASVNPNFDCRPEGLCNFPSGSTCTDNPIRCRQTSDLCPPKAWFNTTSPDPIVCCYPN